MSSYRIGMNLRVTEDSNQGGRRYMEDRHSIRFVKNDEGGFEFAYFGIFDGHGGGEASKYARDHLLNEITKYDCFWSDNDEDILYAIKSAFLDTHYGMWKQLESWPKTNSGLPSTAGTTASICIIKNSKLYIGHVGDSGIVLGYDERKNESCIPSKAKMLTIDHKPDSPAERERIEGSGGQVVAKAGVQRVVWNRPRVNHKGPIRRSTQIDRIPFLAVARSLGDLWSYNYLKEEFVVSPEPDVSVHQLHPELDKCLVIGSDGLWNMLSADESVSMVLDLEKQFENKVINDPSVPVSYWINPAERLVQCALNKWRMRMMKADNTSCIVVLIDPLGPRKLSILKRKREEQMRKVLEKPPPDGKTSVNLLAPTGSLSKSPKKIKDKNGKLVDITKPVALWKEPIRFSLSSTTKADEKPVPISNSPMHKFSDALDDSIQLRNAHIVTPVTFPEPQENKLATKPAASPTRTSSHKTSPLQTRASENTHRSGMATRSSPNKPPCVTLDSKSSGKQITSSSSVNKSKTSDSNHAKESNASSRMNQISPNSPPHQKCLQPSKQSLDNVRMNKLTTNIKNKDLENMFSNSDVKLNLKNLNISKYPSKVKGSKNLNNSNTSEGNKTSKKSHATRSLSSRISLRLRRIRQKSKVKSQTENEGFVAKPGMKRKLESSSGPPATKKLRHS